MRACDNGMPFSKLAVHNGGFGSPGFDCKIVGILGQHLNTVGVGRELVSIHKHSTTVVIAPELIGERCIIGKRILPHSDLGSLCTVLGVVGEPLERAAAASPREEGQLAGADDFKLWVSQLELAPAASIVTTRTETEVGSSTEDEVGDGAVAGTVEDSAVAEICAAGEDKKGACRRPGLLDQRRLCDGDHGIVRA